MSDLETQYADVLSALHDAGINAYVECTGGSIYTIRVDVGGSHYVILVSKGHEGIAHDRTEHKVFEIMSYDGDDSEWWLHHGEAESSDDLVLQVKDAISTAQYYAAVSRGLHTMALRLMVQEPMTLTKVSHDEPHGWNITVHLGHDCYLMIKRSDKPQSYQSNGSWLVMHFADCEWSHGEILSDDASLEKAGVIVREQLAKHDTEDKPEE